MEEDNVYVAELHFMLTFYVCYLLFSNAGKDPGVAILSCAEVRTLLLVRCHAASLHLCPAHLGTHGTIYTFSYPKIGWH